MNCTAAVRIKPFFDWNYTFSQLNTKRQVGPQEIVDLGYYYNHNKYCYFSVEGFYNSITHNGAFSSEQLHNIDRLDAIDHFSHNWDGYGSKRIPSNVIKKSKQLLLFLPYQPVVYPTGRESIQMQYELGDKSYLEFEVFDDRIDVLIVPKRIYQNAITRTIGNVDKKAVEEIIREFYDRAD